MKKHSNEKRASQVVCKARSLSLGELYFPYLRW